MCYFFKIYYEKIFWDVYYFFNIKNIMNTSFISKIIINSSCGKFFLDKSRIKSFYFNIFDIFNQKPLFIKCKKSISEFNVKKGDNISLKLTLRKYKMYDFFYKFLIICIPLIKNFSGFYKKFDYFGNYNFGISDINIFFENSIEFLEFNQGLNFNIVFKNSSFEKSFYILNKLNFPFINV